MGTQWAYNGHIMGRNGHIMDIQWYVTNLIWSMAMFEICGFTPRFWPTGLVATLPSSLAIDEDYHDIYTCVYIYMNPILR